MTTVTIPDWTAEGVLPPVDPNDSLSKNRSPYRVTLPDFVLRFGTTGSRISVLEGFLQYRTALHATGLTSGFQWLDGSYLENVESLESRPPNDIDVVTFFRLPAGQSQSIIYHKNPEIFDRFHVKSVYTVDSFFEELAIEQEQVIKRGNYWYSVWSHRRSGVWKGYVEIDLAQLHDAEAASQLARLQRNGGGK